MEQDCGDTWLIVLICEARITWFPVVGLMAVIRFRAVCVNWHFQRCAHLSIEWTLCMWRTFCAHRLPHREHRITLSLTSWPSVGL